LFDPDDAGRMAALKSFPLFLHEGVNARVLVLPQGEDPDSYIHAHGPDAFMELLEGAMPIFDFYLDQALTHMDKGVGGKLKVLHEVLPIFSDLDGGAIRSLYVKQFSERTGIDEGIVWDELKRKKNGQGIMSRPSLQRNVSQAQDMRKYGSDIQFLNLLLHYPETIDTFRDQEWELIVSDPDIAAIIRILMQRVQEKKDIDKVETFLEGVDAKKQLRAVLLSQPFYAEEMAENAVKEFMRKITKRTISRSMTQARAEGDIQMLNRLIRAKQDLDGV
jgi:DNA primase